MRHPLLLIVITGLLCMSLNASSQNLLKPAKQKIIRCYTVERMEEYRRSNPAAETDAQFEAWLSKEIKSRKQSGHLRPLASYTIPVIFHIVHNGEAVGTSPNLDAGFIGEQILQLNKDFSNVSNSPYAVAATTDIRFVLAQTNPSSTVLPEPGIDRINRNTNSWTDYSAAGWDPAYIDATVKPASTWDATRYLNVWIIPNLVNGTDDILGYSTFPASSGLSGLNNLETINTAGIVVLTGSVGSTFFPNNCNGYGQGKTLAHEAGHFFGLRHIWGDANCGNDFCDDTPVHTASNSGVPTHPKSNSCGTADEMFENFMDYSDDIVLNTFTAKQVERMQTVMLNSPRRLSLSTSTVGQVNVTASNRISFINCSEALRVSESGVNSNYPRFKDISLTLSVEDKATGSATVTVEATGTAIAGTQYTLLTPTLNFATGDNFKPVNLRIYDNALVDGDRTIILNYTISGTGVTAGTNGQTVTIDLQDDDNMRVGENTINLLDEHFENPTGIRGLPSGWGLLSTTGYVNGFVASTNGDAGGTGLSAHISNNTTTKPNTYTKGISGASVLQSPVIDASAVLALGNLSFTYKTSGLVDNDEASLLYTPSTAPFGPFYYYGNTPGATGYGPYSNNLTPVTNAPVIAAPGSLVSRKFNLTFYWETGTNASGTNPGFNVDDIVLTATPYHVETAVSSSYTFDITGGINVNNFKSGNNKAIASLINPSQNVSGVIARITQAGNGNVAINTGSGNYLRTQKVFQISPTVPNTTATYQATLFFTNAELAIWGADRLNLKILKVKDGVSLSGVLNSSVAELITPVVAEDVAGGYISYTGTFTGFSQYMLVSPLAVVPVNLISFQATASQKSIDLVWSTSQEINSRGFKIERSADGNTFKEIGWVDGNGTTSLTSIYNFIDNDVLAGITYYYRLRQVDKDNREVYSAVKNARLQPHSGISVSVSPNPAKNFANVVIAGSAGKATLVLINAAGQKQLQRTGLNAASGIYKLPVSGLPKGVYNLVVYLPEGAFVKKIILD